MPNRAVTAAEYLLDGVPSRVDETEEISSRIERIKVPDSEGISPEGLGRVLASFESQLMELNQTLRQSVNSNVRRLKAECEKTEEEVRGLNSELNVVVRREAG